MMVEVNDAAASGTGDAPETSSNSDSIHKIGKNANLITTGILQCYRPPLEKVKNELDELLNKQNNLMEKMQYENQQLTEIGGDGQLNGMYMMIRTYRSKLSHIKRRMGNVHERTLKLKRRAMRLQNITAKRCTEASHKENAKTPKEPVSPDEPSNS